MLNFKVSAVVLLMAFCLLEAKAEVTYGINPRVKVTRMIDHYEEYKKLNDVVVYGYLIEIENRLMLVGSLSDKNIGYAVVDEGVDLTFDESAFELNKSCLNMQARITTVDKIKKERSVLVPGYRYTLHAQLVHVVDSNKGKVNASNCLELKTGSE